MLAPFALFALLVQSQGAPTPYWQQRLEYDIAASLDEARGVLAGTERVVYHNNSPDALRTISFHLYLNAFRPGSRWADQDSIEQRRRFNDLEDPDFGFNHVSDVRIMGERVRAEYPFAPDSTVVRFALPRSLASGDSLTVSMAWEARPSTVPRRQGRRGRAFDFAQWYPRVVAYDKYGWEEHPLYPAGEFYGDFGDFRVTLDVPEDQVVGATGVPVCGDPGWERANRNRNRPVEYQRDAYGPIPCPAPAALPGRKQIIWVAKDVHHFAMSMNPAYRYEGGRFGKVAVHVLYKAGDESTWAGGRAVRNTETALQWLDGLYGPFPWPQMTNVHRIEGGGTEFPMMVHDGSAGLGLILHEVGHNYTMGILANNEWKEGFLDEGFTSFQTSWYQQLHPDSAAGSGRGAGVGGVAQDERTILLMDLDGWSEPTSLVSEHYRDFSTYNSMVYDRGELFYHQLRTIVGDSTMRAILRTFYQRWKLKHVDEEAFRAVAEEVSKRDLSTFFGQWLHTTDLYDYAVGKVRTGRREDGRTGGWVTRVEVVRKAPGMFPVEVVVRSGTDSAMTRTVGLAEREWVELTTRDRPREVELDPHTRSHDWDALNNRKRRGLFGWTRSPRNEVYLDPLFSQRTRRDRQTLGLVPTLWYSDFGGATFGARLRTDYLGRFEQNVLLFSVEAKRVGKSEDGEPQGIGWHARFRNPTRLQMPRTTQSLELWRAEGRTGAAVAVERQKRNHRSYGPQTWTGAGVRWMAVNDTRYLDHALWDAGGTVEGQTWIRSREVRGRLTLSGRLSVGGGVEYRNEGGGTSTTHRYDVQPYFRATVEGVARRSLDSAGRASFGLRVYGGLIESGEQPLKQRQIFVAGADPYEQYANPFLRSIGSPLAGSDVHYQTPGGGGVRGLAPGTTATRLLAVNAELDRSVYSRKRPAARDSARTRLFSDVRVSAFGDAALGNGDLPRTGESASLVADAGLGVRIAHRISQTPFVTRFDFPLIVSRGRLAVQDQSAPFHFRWVVSFSPAF